MKKVKKPIRNILCKILEPLFSKKFIKHYITPFLVLKKKVPYNAKEYFESWHKSTFNHEFSARVTISPYYNVLFSRFHYNAVENSILKYLVRPGMGSRARILDIGSGSGYWIDFYTDLFDPQLITGVEISEVCVNALKNKYRDKKNVKIAVGDISQADFELKETFDLINAVGVMFHIIEDKDWETALSNLGKHLNPRGIIVVGGQFGRITRDVQFHAKDRFSTWGETANPTSNRVLVNKRIRSLRYWKRCAHRNGLKVSALIKTQRDSRIQTPENNILILTQS